MRKYFTTLFNVVIACALVGCSQTQTRPSAEGEFTAVDSPSFDSPDMEEAALAAAQSFVRAEYAPDAKFDPDQVTVKSTDVPNRFKIMQRFDSELNDGYNFVYRIWVQKFATEWEFGNLGIERAGGARVLTTNGRLKEMERNEITRTEEGEAGGVKYTIIKRNAPYYVRVYTPKRLNKRDAKNIHDQLKSQYEQVQFTKSENPDDEDYMAIMGKTLFEYDIDKISKISD